MSALTPFTVESTFGEELRPPGKMKPEEIIHWVKKKAYISSPIYKEDFSRHRKSELYDQGDQWIQRSRSLRDSGVPSQWRMMRATGGDENSLPLPVYNEGVLIRENESARLGRPEYKPKVRPSGKNPGIKEKDGAKGAERALQSRLKEMWSDEEDKLFLHMPMYGGAYLKSYWDQTWMETVRVPAPSLCCPRHPKSGQPPMPMPMPQEQEMEEGLEVPPSPESLLEGEVPEPSSIDTDALLEQASAPPPTCSYCRVKEREGEPPHSDGGNCPHCPDSPALLPYSPTLDEALNSDLGIDVPKGDWFLKVPFPYQIFPKDAGIDVNPNDIEEWEEVYISDLSEVEKRWPDKIRDTQTGNLRVHPQNPATLMADNPSLGSPDVMEHAQHTGVFRTHYVVYEYHRKPWLEWNQESRKHLKNRGRSIVVVMGLNGDGVVCLDDHLMLESLNKPGTFVARVHLQYIVWEKKDGGRRTTVGQSLWDRVFDAQDGINERASQTRAVNQRGALPWYLQKAGITLETKVADSAVPFRRVVVDIDPNDKTPPFQLLNNEVINPGVYQEIEFNVQYIGKNVVEVERGQVPPGVAAATAIAYLKTESGEKRRPRILRIRRSLTRAWEHGAQLMSALYIEDRPYTYQDDEEGSEERQAFISGDVIAQANPKVDIYPTPDYDITDARRESIRDQVQLGILNPTQTPQLARKISAAMDESLDFFLDDDLQEQQAQREWREFQESQRVPVVDPSLDDDMTHYQEHGRACFSEWYREQENVGDWDGALLVLGGDWEESLKRVVMVAVMPRAGMQMLGGGAGAEGGMPGAPQPPQPPSPGPSFEMPGAQPPAPPGMMGDGVPGQPPGQPAQPPAPPPPPSLQALIEIFWTSKLQAAGIITGSGDPREQALTEVLIPWRAHMEAHKLKVQMNQMRAALAQPAVPAPGTGSAPTSPDEAQVESGGEVPAPGIPPAPPPAG